MSLTHLRSFLLFYTVFLFISSFNFFRFYAPLLVVVVVVLVDTFAADISSIIFLALELLRRVHPHTTLTTTNISRPVLSPSAYHPLQTLHRKMAKEGREGGEGGELWRRIYGRRSQWRLPCHDSRETH